MQVTDASKAEVARRERERLRLQAKQKKDQLEKLRDQQNDDTATGEVSSHQSFLIRRCPLLTGRQSISYRITLDLSPTYQLIHGHLIAG